MYRLLKPLAFSFSLVTRVLILGRMLSLVSVTRSSRMRNVVWRVQVAGLIIAVASSIVSCVLMWIATVFTFRSAHAYSVAANVVNSSSSVDLAFRTAISARDFSNYLDRLNNSFLLGFYSIYAAACIVVTAVVFQILRVLLQNVESQKLLLDALRMPENTKLAAINNVADQKLEKVRTILKKVALNCSVVVIAALFSILIDSFSVMDGNAPSPPPCPSDANLCDECKVLVAISLLTPALSYFSRARYSDTFCMQHSNMAADEVD
jgi:hypothetical protein